MNEVARATHIVRSTRKVEHVHMRGQLVTFVVPSLFGGVAVGRVGVRSLPWLWRVRCGLHVQQHS
eukprot:4738572-Prymnesium_polylepis.2